MFLNTFPKSANTGYKILSFLFCLAVFGMNVSLARDVNSLSASIRLHLVFKLLSKLLAKMCSSDVLSPRKVGPVNIAAIKPREVYCPAGLGRSGTPYGALSTSNCYHDKYSLPAGLRGLMSIIA